MAYSGDGEYLRCALVGVILCCIFIQAPPSKIAGAAVALTQRGEHGYVQESCFSAHLGCFPGELGETQSVAPEINVRQVWPRWANSGPMSTSNSGQIRATSGQQLGRIGGARAKCVRIFGETSARCWANSDRCWARIGPLGPLSRVPAIMADLSRKWAEALPTLWVCLACAVPPWAAGAGWSGLVSLAQCLLRRRLRIPRHFGMCTASGGLARPASDAHTGQRAFPFLVSPP